MREFKIYPSNLRRHRKDTHNTTKFKYVRVNLIFQPSLALGKPRIELKKVKKSINTTEKVSFVLQPYCPFFLPENYITK